MRLGEFPRRADAAAAEATDTGPVLQRIAYHVIGPVKRHTRVRTGALRNSIHDRVEPSRAVIATNVEYAAYVNARFPFMAPGLAEAMPRVEAELQAFGKKIASELRG